MVPPYTAEPLEAYMAAQTAVGATLTAIAVHKPMRSRLGTALLIAAIWIVVVAPIEAAFFRGIGVHIESANDSLRLVYVLRVATTIALLSTFFSRRLSLCAIGVVGAGILYWLSGSIKDSDWEVAALHLAYFGLIVGCIARERTPVAVADITEPPLARTIDDWIIFGLAVLLATIVCVVVLHRETDSADEWSYTYQAAIFARGRAYADAPPCWAAFQNFWVFESSGRNFSQYTPGWPLFMAPFFLVRAVWLAGPVALGLFAVGVARLARRAAAGFSAGTQPPPRSLVRAAGWFAALATMLSATMLINGGSRFPHVLVGATFAWALECLCEMTTPGVAHDRQWTAGLVCGAAAMMTASTRPPDGVTLGFGMLVYAIWALARRRLPWRAAAGTIASFVLVGGLTLVILRLQLGKWFATGYSLNDTFHPWNKFGYSVPSWSELRAGAPLATGAYWWWPCSPAVGIAGLAMLHGRGRRVAVVMFMSSLAFVGIYEAIEFGRHLNFGYGPRFQLPLVVPMAVGTGVALGRLWHTARARVTSMTALRAGGPIAIAIVAALVGVVRIAPLLYPYTHASVMNHDALHEALEPMHFTNAIVYGSRGLGTDVRDLTENLPLDLYPDQDVIVANDLTPGLRQCVEGTYPNRKLYRAIPGPQIHFQELPR